jgi:hypothetical protein
VRPFHLSTAEGGINRLRTRGGASADSLYDLLNGYVEQDGSVVCRPGSVTEITLADSCKGLCAHEGQLVSFTHDPGDTTTGNSKYRVEVIVDPTDADSPIATVHFARAYLGYLYVVATFETGNTYHYWLQPGETWAAETNYTVGSVVVPSTPNGFAYRASRLGNPNPVWAAGVPRETGDIVEPTTANGWQFTVTAHTNDPSPTRSGDTEPTWNTGEGAITIEDADIGAPPAPPTTGSTTPGGDDGSGGQPPPPGIGDRYNYDGDFPLVNP